MLSNDTKQKVGINQSRENQINKIIDLSQYKSKSFYDEQLKKSRIQVSFESGQLSQMKLFESFKLRHQYEKDESIEDCETFIQKEKAKNAENDISNPSSQFDLQAKSQQQIGIKQSQSKELDSQQSFSAYGNKNKKVSDHYIGGETDEANACENNQYYQLNDSKKLNKKESIQENEVSQINEDPNISNQYNHNNEEKNPLTKSMLYGRRGSRKNPGGLNASGMFIKDSNGPNTPNNIGDKNAIERMNQMPIIQKGGFFFAMKMKKYANQLVSRLQSRRYTGLRQRHLQFFNDKTIIPNDQTGVFKSGGHDEETDEHEVMTSAHIQKKFIFMIKKLYQRIVPLKIRQTVKFLPLFSPSHTIKLIWDFLNMISIAYFLIFFPLRIAFGLDIHQSPASYVALGVIFFDILVYLNTGFYDKGALVTDRVGILLHYIDSRFYTDILSLIPFIFYNFSDADQNVFQDKIKFTESAISLLFLVRVSQLGQIKKKIEEKFYQKKTLAHVISLLTLLSLTLYIAHLFSCFWIIIAQYQIDEDTWMQYAKVDVDTWLVQYLYSLYFLIITMTTVGYGDIKPQNNIEHLFIIIIVLISSGVFSFSINKIGNNYLQKYKQTKIFLQKYQLSIFQISIFQILFNSNRL